MSENLQYGYKRGGDKIARVEDQAAVVCWIGARRELLIKQDPRMPLDCIDDQIAREVRRGARACAALLLSNPTVKLIDVLDGTVPEGQIEAALAVPMGTLQSAHIKHRSYLDPLVHKAVFGNAIHSCPAKHDWAFSVTSGPVESIISPELFEQVRGALTRTESEYFEEMR